MKKLVLLFVLFQSLTFFAQAQTTTQKVYATIVNNQPEALQALLAAGADANAPVVMVSGFPTTFLILAAGKGQLELVKILVKYKAQIDKPDSFNATALMAAADQGSAEVTAFLLASGANPTARDNDGKDVLAHAKESGSSDVVKLIHKAK
ncbi:ankyrin repeat domain-containing protein [Hymenobacter canadensis]|uniref:Ankyrin repeat domain-containing protein n=1 Tax=Hymenobacter canadensis TaxID=2999067 RepID=A0ABY7LSP6_9BACT|nr:ankyrin repeat domain-containing protein [Hymenobacter canadensis]WBA43431.1 ankyrin repeat domain-containing protein [Hymenobacter canadensis]